LSSDTLTGLPFTKKSKFCIPNFRSETELFAQDTFIEAVAGIEQ